MARPEKIRLGDLLVQQKLISQDQLNFALEQQQRQSSGRKLGRVLVENAFITEDNICESLSMQLGIPYINLKHFQINHALVRLLKEDQARQFQAIVLEKRNDYFLVGMADPTDMVATEGIGRILHHRIDLAVVSEGQLLETLDLGYLRSQRILGLD